MMHHGLQGEIDTKVECRRVVCVVVVHDVLGFCGI